MARGRVIARGGQAHRAVAAQRHDGLDRSLAKALGADDDGAAVILQRTRHDFRGGGRAAVDQNDQRFTLGQVAGLGVVTVTISRIAAPGRDDFAFVEEGIGHHDRLVQQAAGVVAQIEHHAVDVVEPARLLDLVGQPRL